MLLFTMFIAVLIQIGFPFLLGAWLARKYKTSWIIFLYGFFAFILSQVVHIPLLQGLTYLFQQGILPQPPQWILPYFNPLVLGLAAGLCEEPARLVAYKLLKERGKPFRAALMLGAGHGGAESAVLVGFSALVSFVLMIAYTIPGVKLGEPLSSQLAVAWTTAWHIPLLAAFERLAAMAMQVALSVMVWLAVSRCKWGWFAVAILVHAVIDFMAVFLISAGWSNFAVEGVIGVVALLSLGFILLVSREMKLQEKEQAEMEMGAEEVELVEIEEELPASDPVEEAESQKEEDSSNPDKENK